MRTFFDPISGDNVDIEKAIVFYLVKNHDDQTNPANNTYCIKGLCTNPNRLAKDPISNAKIYWPINKDKILNNPHQEQLFPNDKLTQEPLSLEKIELFFECNPNELPHQDFNKGISAQLNQWWLDNLPKEKPQGVLKVDFASDEQIAKLVHLSQHFFVAKNLEGYLAAPVQHLIDFFKNTSLPTELIAHGFTPDHLLTLAFDHKNMSELFSRDCLQAIEEQIITADNFLDMHSREMRLLLIDPDCLKALRSKETCVRTLLRLSITDLKHAIEQHHFPSQYPSLS